ncbi:MAG: sensor histidine kinase [Candidatus Limnocylindrales bacterium]
MWGLGCFVLLIVWLVVVTVAAVSWLAARTLGPGGAPALAGFLVVAGLAVLALVVLLVRGARGIAVPLDDLTEAAGRLQAGDYAARVPEWRRGPRAMRQLSRAFNTMAGRLETDERQRRELLAEISHELRTPLSVLQGELEAMLDGIHPLDAAHLAGTLEETRVLARLVEDLRTLALAEAGTLALHREPTDLGVLIEELASAFRPQAEAAQVELRAAVDDSLPLLEVDPIRLREVLANLVSNALRYAPPESEVRIAATREAHADATLPWSDEVGPVARVIVSDAGPGIPPGLLPHVFDRFAKASDSRGSGLGLAIARQLVEAHGGRIGVTSSFAAGTAVRFELPLHQQG